ncbi:hypothetical protein TOPH_07262 [Tolypocladium ophioglossoides CBS 100239]|uniref:Uncharacterized protein n=1 Tax=Tolypocladium ophioglossoides (strain CBS 100239) TaxID=1163406 RepID=A0A0L0N1Z8_TOLOC|nr:hypothetical protein TOPH_07262 [Tolypocladium ophioglossoides CBS 100239]
MQQQPPSGWAALAYREPSITNILIQASFLLASNVLNHVVDLLLYCGLVGQILVGVAWGIPGGGILPKEVESTMVQLGYIGLILIVFEGGLSTDFRSLKANIFLSTGVAVTGIGVPIALSFILEPLIGVSRLQCFAAGAALCSTSLGTTFTVLRSSGLTDSRLGVVLASAAMLDDVVGLVMVQVVSNLGAADAALSAATTLRPILVSLAFAVLTPAVCLVLIKPMTLALNSHRQRHSGSRIDKLLRERGAALATHTMFLLGMVTVSSYAGTSNLFAAYIAGAVISWWDVEVPHDAPLEGPAQQGATATSSASALDSTDTDSSCKSSGQAVYTYSYEPVVQRLLQPFFFGSIGFSIPITQMFSGAVVWKGIVYAILMCFGKLACGVWLIRFPGVMTAIKYHVKRLKVVGRGSISTAVELHRRSKQMSDETQEESAATEHQRQGNKGPGDDSGDTVSAPDGRSPCESNSAEGAGCDQGQAASINSSANPMRPLSIYPAAILGCAMVARGEIGFLISSLAQSSGVFGGADDAGVSEMFLVVTWAIVLCTILGPLCTGDCTFTTRAISAHQWPRMPKEKNYNPVQAQRKADKAKAIKKGKAEVQDRRNERLARKNPERIQKQLDDLKAITSKGGKLTSHEEQTLGGLEKELRAVTRAREAVGDRAPTFRGRRDDGGPGVLGKRRRGSQDASSSEEEVPEDVQRIPMPRDTPPPIPKGVLDKWYSKRRARRNVENAARQERDGQEGDGGTEKATKEMPVTEPKTVYEAKPVMRDLRQEAVSAFVPAAVQVKMAKGRGQGGLMEPEEADRLEREGYLKSTPAESRAAGAAPASRTVTVEEVEDEEG